MNNSIFNFTKEIRGGLKKIKGAQISSNLVNQLIALDLTSAQMQKGIESVIRRRIDAKQPEVETIEELLSEVVTDQILRNNLR
jgi:ubiquinone biosynthesis protein COQ9